MNGVNESVNGYVIIGYNQTTKLDMMLLIRLSIDGRKEMIRRKDEHKTTTMENGFGGNGSIEFKHLTTKEDLLEKGRLFAITTFKPGVSLGYHVHQADFEVYHVLKGQGTLNDNGVECTLNAGDTAWMKPGQGHSFANNSKEDLVFIALILYA